MSDLDEKTIERLRRAGMLREKYYEYIEIAAVWKSEYDKTASMMQAYLNTAEICNKTDITVMRAVKAVRKLDGQI